MPSWPAPATGRGFDAPEQRVCSGGQSSGSNVKCPAVSGDEPRHTDHTGTAALGRSRGAALGRHERIAPISCNAMPNPLRHLIIEQMTSSAPYCNWCHYAALSDLGNCIGHSSTSECFAVGQTIQRKSKAAVPLYRAPERGCCCSDAGALEGWVKNWPDPIRWSGFSLNA